MTAISANCSHGVIYKFTNKINNKEYIGQTWHYNKRIKEHFKGYGYAKLLCSAIKKYGRENFNVKILFRTSIQTLLDNAEIICIKLSNTLSPNGYNIAPGGLGGKLSEETKIKIGNFNRNKIVSQETRDKISKTNKGRKISQEIKDKIAYTKRNKENKLYVFNCRTHEKIAEFKNHHDMTIETGVKNYRIYSSIKTFSYFKYKNNYCYVRNTDSPLELDFSLGKMVQINDEKGGVFKYPSITIATKEMGIGRGIISEIARGKCKRSKYVKDGETIYFTAKYIN